MAEKSNRVSSSRACVAAVLVVLAPALSACSIPQVFSEPFEQGVYKDILERQAEGMPVDDGRLKDLPPMTAADYEALGDSYLARNDVVQAQVKYQKALELNPDSWQLQYKIGLVLLKTGAVRESIPHFDAIIQADPMNARGYEGKGRALLALREHEEAEVALRRAVDLDSGLWKAHEALGVLYDQLGAFDESIAEYKVALTVQPDDPSVLNNLGVAYYLKKDYPKAIATLERALMFARETDRSRTYNNLGRAYAKTGDYKRAFESFRRGADAPTAYNNIGLVYLEEGRTRQAASCFEKAIQESPSYYAAANENLIAARQGLPPSDNGEAVRLAGACP